MDETVLDALQSLDWSARVSALAALEKSIFKAQSVDELLSLQVGIDARFEEDADKINTVEILILREYFCEAAIAFQDTEGVLTSHLFYYVQDRLPDTYPSWGRILQDGVSNLGDPWIVASVFGGMVSVLLLVTFVGEAVREAFDPKKFTTYR